MRVTGMSMYDISITPEYRALEAAVPGGYVEDWNDAPERTQAEVIEAFKKAADLARAEA